MNIGNPSPQEIYDSYSQIPNTPQGKQQLSQLVQAFKNSGDMRGSIATSILNSYNTQQPPAPPPPQGQIADHVIAQAEPQQMGIAAPGLENFMPQSQGMAGGGLVAFAGGGPVRGFWDGGSTDSDYNPFMDAMPQVPDAPDISDVEQDYYSPPAPTPTTQRTVGAGESDRPSFEERISSLQKLYGTPPDVAAEMISRMEHDKAKREKFNTFENIASALGGYLGAYGPGAHRAGVGIASMLSTMGAHERADREDQNTMDALRYKAAMQPYELHKGLVDQVLAAQSAHDKAQQEAALKLKIAKMEQETAYGKERIGGEYGLRREDVQGQTYRDVAGINKEARIEAAKKSGEAGPGGMNWNQAVDAAQADMQNMDNPITNPVAAQAKVLELAERYYRLGRGGSTGSTNQTSSSFGQPLQLTRPGGNGFTGWLR